MIMLRHVRAVFVVVALPLQWRVIVGIVID
jgi:hypothetical protein